MTDEGNIDQFESEEELQARLDATWPQPLPSANDLIFKKTTDNDRAWFDQFFPRKAVYLEAYKMAADLLFREFERKRIESQAGHALDVEHWLVFPIYFIYRHAIELSLKQMSAARAADLGIEVESAITHDLFDLWKEIEDWARDICGASLAAEADAFGHLVKEIQHVDPKGDAGRYAERTNRRPSFHGIQPLDLVNLRDTCTKMLNVLTWVWSLRDEKRQDAEVQQR